MALTHSRRLFRKLLPESKPTEPLAVPPVSSSFPSTASPGGPSLFNLLVLKRDGDPQTKSLLLRSLMPDLLRLVALAVESDRDFLALRHSCVRMYHITSKDTCGARMDRIFSANRAYELERRRPMPGGRPYHDERHERVEAMAVPHVPQCVEFAARPPLPHPLREVASIVAEVAALSVEPNATVAAEWMRMGLAEHASIASFALVAQKLLAVGAPMQAVTEALLCAQEEIGHAELSFAMAAATGHANAHAPPAYPSHMTDVSNDIDVLFADTIEEGCVAETVGALEAAAKCDAEPNATVAAVWQRVAMDEAYHASFGWRTVAWIGQRDPKRYAQLMREQIEHELHGVEPRYAAVVKAIAGLNAQHPATRGTTWNAVVALLMAGSS